MVSPLDVGFVRSHFPALASDWAIMENAGGTLVPRQVIERLHSYLSFNQIQPGAEFPISAQAAERIAESERLMAAMIGAEPGEVLIGPSTTMNVFLLSHAIRPWLKPGDEVIVTNLDHEANNGAWRRLAEVGVVVREWSFNLDTAALEAHDLRALLTDRTRLVCFTQCSNVVGTIHDVAGLTHIAHDAGALVCVDAVAYAPHRHLDVKALGVDFYLTSLYKIYGPHLGMLYGRRDLLRKADRLNHFFTDDDVPLRLHPGGVNHELTASLSGVTAYFDALHDRHFGPTNLPLHDRLGQVFGLIADHEETLCRPLLEFLGGHPRVRLNGSRDPDQRARVPTVTFTVKDRKADEIPTALLPHRIGIRAGDFYARRAIDTWNLGPQGGVVRASIVHYNTVEEVNRLVAALDRVI
ncbi:MAG: cysteine desulfurase-like protein [Alphaproteobacteria bacterium]|nr:cysteine desulfurase-like protein [Alphaproteobacteria bacterium]